MDRDIVGLTRPLPACPAGEAVSRLGRGPSQLSISPPPGWRPDGPPARGGLGIPSDSLGNSFTGRTSRPGSRRPLGSREPGDEPSVLNATVKRSRMPDSREYDAMLHKFPSPIVNGGMKLALPLALVSLGLLGTTLRADSTSASKVTPVASPDLGLIESGPNMPKTLELGTLSGSEPTQVGSRASVGSSILPATKGVPTSPPTGSSTFTELRVIENQDIFATPRDEDRFDRAADTTFPINGLVRLLVFGTVGFLILRRLQHRWTRHPASPTRVHSSRLTAGRMRFPFRSTDG